MKVIRLLFLSLMACIFAQKTNAQRLDITLTDNTVVSYDVSKIQYMEVMQEGTPGHISGHWYLGYRVVGTSTMHYDGTEKLTFNGDVLTWTKVTGTEIYDLTYAEDNKSFRAQARSTGNTTSYTVITYENDMLVLKQSSVLRYFYKSPDAAHNAELLSFPNRKETSDINAILRYKNGVSNSSITPMGKHFENRHQTTEEDIEWLANPANQPNTVVGNYNSWKAKTVNLYPYGVPKPADVNQHAIGDCCLCAVLASFAYIYPGFIQNIITKETSTRFSVKMYDPQGNPVTVVVDNKFLCDSGGNLAQMTGKNNVCTWATVLEKALMKWQTIYQCNGIEGIGTEHAAPPFTGCGDSFAFSPGTLFPDEMSAVVDWALQNGMVSVGGFNKGDLLCGTLTTVTGHAFTVMYTTQPESYRFSMRNPWGITACDGVLEIPNKYEILRTMDFRLVYPGAAAPFKEENLGGYVLPKFAPKAGDLGVDKRLLRMVGLESYGPEREVKTTEK